MTPWKKWKTRWLYWEFWPFWFFYIPVGIYFLLLSIRARSFFFFTATNPTMEFGGMLGERKSEIHKLIPEKYLPRTVLVNESNRTALADLMTNFEYPVIVKPDIGERGRGVEVIRSQEELHAYARRYPIDFLVQEFVDLPVELGVFFVRHPNEDSGRVTSLVTKEFYRLNGDGTRTVGELVAADPRGSLQIDLTHPRFSGLKDQVLKNEESIVLEAIGNHCRGTKFLDATSEIDDKLTRAINQLASDIPGFYYGRFDLKCGSIDDLRELRNFKILELNGVGGEPAHIYQPGFSLPKAYRVVFWHFGQMAKIARANHRAGISYWSFQHGIKKLSDIRAYNHRLTTA